MVGTVLDLNELLGPATNNLAVSISRKYTEWEIYRSTWMTQKQELRNYLFATDTTSTSNKTLPWKNSTTVPKLTQLRDSLHANYMTALFPNDNWLQWEGSALQDEVEDKRKAIEGYMKTKFRQGRQELEISKLLLDFIDFGNCFATAEWCDETIPNEKTGNTQYGYVGPKIVRIAPQDIVFNPVATNFDDSPKIIRTLTTIGELKKKAARMPKDSLKRKELEEALDHSVNIRRTVQALAQGDVFKAEGYIMDGFSSIRLYYESDYVELLTFYGDLYDSDNDTLLENHKITIMDRSFVVEKTPNPDWMAKPGIFHAGWRQRPDNLYAMGPLDNLVGMQYRIDHLENLKADVFDLIAYPVLKVKGYVDDFEYGPGERIYVGDDGDVAMVTPDPTALQADSQIELLERRMEELAGAPKEAMGFRTPGEKTAFEVQLLDNAASRIFINKITSFEQSFFLPLLNYMLQLARRNMSAQDVVRTLNSQVDAVVFSTITKEDIIANGILRPQGATIFAQRANTLQTLTQIGNSHWAQDPTVNIHLSGKKIAKMIQDLAELQQYGIYGENIRVLEQGETQKLMNHVQEQVQVNQATPPGLLPSDPASPVAPTGAAPTPAAIQAQQARQK